MKLRFLRNYLDFHKGKNYDVLPESTAKYLISMNAAKEVVKKDGSKDVEDSTGKTTETVETNVDKDSTEKTAETVETNIEEDSTGEKVETDTEDLLGLFD